MKCQEQLYRDTDFLLPFTTGYILRTHAASANDNFDLSVDSLCYLAEWKHVLVYGRRISTAAYRVSGSPTMDFERKLEDPCQDLPKTAVSCINFTREKTADLSEDGITKLCRSTMPAITAGSGENVDMRRAAEQYRKLDLYEPEKQESL